VWIPLLLILFQMSSVPQGQSPCRETPPPAGAPTFVVQAVDPNWQAVAGVKVTLISESDKKKIQSEFTDAQGYARFWVPAAGHDQNYSLKFESGFKKNELKNVPYPAAAPVATAYVQVRLSLDMKGSVTVY
jgi:hypothetical protein